jgi:hypothetical protein
MNCGKNRLMPTGFRVVKYALMMLILQLGYAGTAEQLTALAKMCKPTWCFLAPHTQT